MLDALKTIVDFIGMIIDLAVKMVTGLLDLLQLIPSMVSTLNQSVSLLPAFLVAFAGVTITVSVIFILVGRNAGGE